MYLYCWMSAEKIEKLRKLQKWEFLHRNFLLYTTENMLPNDNVSVSVGHLDHVLIVYSLTEHVTWKSPGPICCWVDRILHPYSCTSVSSWSKVPLLSIWSVAVPLCRPLLPCPSRWHGSLPRHGLWWLTCELYCFPLPWRLGSVYQLWKSPLLQLCKVRSFYVIDCTNWMNLFNTIRSRISTYFSFAKYWWADVPYFILSAYFRTLN